MHEIPEQNKPEHSNAATEREWKVGDRCRATRFGESKNGTIVALAYRGEVAMVLRDGEYVERHYLARRLNEAVDE